MNILYVSRRFLGSVGIVFLAYVPCAFSQDTELSPPQKDALSLALRDGTSVIGTVELKEMEVETVYGNLKVPITDILHIRIGTKSMPDLKKRIDALIADLGDNSYEKRENASKELAKLGALVRAELEAARQSPDPEVVTRATALLDELGKNDEVPPSDDEVKTKAFLICGTVKFDTLSVVTERAKVKIEKKDIASLMMGSGDSLPSLANGLVAHWKFDEKEGATVLDSGPNKLDGRLQEYADGDKRWVKGRVGGALQLNGTTNSIKIPNSEEILNPRKSDWTVCLWLKGAQAAPNAGVIFGKNAEPQGPRGRLALSMTLQPNGLVDWVADAANLFPQNAVSKTVVADDKWHHLAGTRAGNKIKLYVDGVLESEVTEPKIPDDIATPFLQFIGRSDIWDGWARGRFGGSLDDFRIYKRELSKEEINALARSAK